jgi:hypothetical protein
VVKHGVCSKRLIPTKILSDFWLNVSLKFLIGCFDLSSFFLLRKDKDFTAANSSSSRIPKTEPLSPITTGLDFAYASNMVEDNSHDPGHVVELSF